MDGFLLARPHSVVRAQGRRAQFHHPADALKTDADVIVGALPFDPAAPAALFVPERWQQHAGPWRPEPATLPPVTLGAEIPSPAEHVDRVTKLIKLIGEGKLQKVVAARAVQVTATEPIRPLQLAAALNARHQRANTFAVTVDGGTLVGASPEVLVSRRGDTVQLCPLAGTAPRHADPADDRAEAEELLASSKNLAEHAFVVDWIRERLAPVCRELSVPDRPELTGTAEVWHLATPIHGVLDAPALTALELAVLLQPTPAVCGTPTELALQTIRDTEGDRGFYGGAVGWCDRAGDGDWIVAIRCATIAAGGRSATAYAGGGIVAASDPVGELDETTAKFATLLGAFGLHA
ncbi:isochorismate synthase [Skermania sp. ID1734]|uniref:isochorismate synthase n=1 Tax=Skermania sp. ID1734 TaxID=2597516 RepID=UPI00117F3095|nr:isochorismate synthase [Skermania sp. ID1734]TSD99337.1 isochorismate synthase [Skermania sp. ID1734]